MTEHNVVTRHHQGGEVHNPDIRHAHVRASEGPLATARTPSGDNLYRAPEATDRVTVKGIEMTIEQAEKMGVVRRDQNGKYVDTPQAELEARDKAARDKADRDRAAADEAAMEHAISVSDATAETLSGLTGMAKEVGFNAPGLLARALASGDIPKELQEIAQHRGMEPAELQEAFHTIEADITAGLVDHLTDHGFEDASGVLTESFRTTPRGELTSMVISLLYEGNASRFVDKARAVFRSRHHGESVAEKDGGEYRGMKTSRVAASHLRIN